MLKSSLKEHTQLYLWNVDTKGWGYWNIAGHKGKFNYWGIKLIPLVTVLHRIPAMLPAHN